VPTVKELLTLVDEEPHQELLLDGTTVYVAIDGRAFPDTPSRAHFWTSSPAVTQAGAQRMTVEFTIGEASFAFDGEQHLVRCVSDH
jgi:hypothetical protein